MIEGTGNEHFYGSAWIDRVEDRRADPAWVAGRLRSDDTLVVPVWRGRSLVAGLGTETAGVPGPRPGDAEGREEAGGGAGGEDRRAEGGPEASRARQPDGGPAAVAIPVAEAAELLDAAGETVLLGIDGDDTAYFAVDVSDLEEDDAALVGRGDLVDLRRVGPLLRAGDGGLLAYARAMVHWHRHHAFCGLCGSSTASEQAGFLRRCRSEACRRLHFPRTDPAVIVLVTHGDRVLLGRQAAWKPRWYSVLAGFVEPGESLESAVRREVHEESGVEVGELRYDSSQPWPFPSSLMIGFTALALTDTLRAGSELEDVRWFTRDEIDAGLAEGSLRLPARTSISRQLIESWRSAGSPKHLPGRSAGADRPR